MKTLTLSLLLALAASAADRTIVLRTPLDAQGRQEVTTMLRVVASVKEASINSAGTSIRVAGDEESVAWAEWMVNKLENRQAPGGDQTIRFFSLPESTSPEAAAKLMTTLRTEQGIQHMLHLSKQHVLVCRGTAAQMDAAERILAAR